MLRFSWASPRLLSHWCHKSSLSLLSRSSGGTGRKRRERWDMSQRVSWREGPGFREAAGQAASSPGWGAPLNSPVLSFERLQLANARSRSSRRTGACSPRSSAWSSRTCSAAP